MSILIVLMLLFSVAVPVAAILWLVTSRGGLRGGADWAKRFERLEGEVRRLGDREAGEDLEDEIRRLDEKVEFLENLLAERSATAALPAPTLEERQAEKKG